MAWVPRKSVGHRRFGRLNDAEFIEKISSFSSFNDDFFYCRRLVKSYMPKKKDDEDLQ